MILAWILISLALLTSCSPQNRDRRRRNRHSRGNVIFFPDEVNSDTEGNDSDSNLEPFNIVSEEDYVELPDWMEIDLNKLSLDKLEVLNNATDLTDLAEFFGLDYENTVKLSGGTNRSQSDLEFRLENEPMSAEIVKKNGEIAKFAQCSPEEVSVELPVPNNALHLPPCVRLKRCGGCCNNDLLKCQPTEVEVFYFKVLKISKGRSSNRRGSRRQNRRGRRSTSGQVISLQQENHVECSCQCKVQEKDCDPLLHNYNKDVCACVCKDETEQRKCEKSKKHYWDKNTCSCMCHKVKECGTGELFSEDSCRCVPALS